MGPGVHIYARQEGVSWQLQTEPQNGPGALEGPQKEGLERWRDGDCLAGPTAVFGMAYHKLLFTRGKSEEGEDTGMEKHLKRDQRQSGT